MSDCRGSTSSPGSTPRLRVNAGTAAGRAHSHAGSPTRRLTWNLKLPLSLCALGLGPQPMLPTSTCLRVSMMWSVCSCAWNVVPSSDANDTSGDSVPLVRMIERKEADSALNATAGLKHHRLSVSSSRARLPRPAARAPASAYTVRRTIASRKSSACSTRSAYLVKTSLTSRSPLVGASTLSAPSAACFGSSAAFSAFSRYEDSALMLS
eukprot:535993-Rhodomonas_salina.2